MAKSPMLETAVNVLEEQGSELTFHDLWEKVIVTMDIDKEAATKRIAKLYSDITLDKRFVSLPDNMWDLKTRRKLEEIIIDTSDIIIDDEEEDLEIEDFHEVELEEEIDEEEEEIELFDDVVLDEEFEDDIEEFEELAINSED